MSHSKRRGQRSILACIYFASVAFASAAEPVRVDLVAGDLKGALEHLQKQTNVEVIYQSAQVAGLRSPAVNGLMTPEEALRKLLEGSPLRVRVDSSGAMLVEATAAATAPTIPARNTSDPPRGDSAGPISRNAGPAANPPAPAGTAITARVNGPGQEPAPDATGPQGRVLEEIIVTAQKRAQSSEDLGLSIQVLRADILENQLVREVEELSQAIPSLDVFRGNGSNNPTITLRGIGTTNPWVNNSPSVAVHTDGFYLPMSTYLNFPIFDLDRVEVLKGPQVGLYGRNSTAGAMNFVTARPTSDPTGYVELTYGSYEALSVTAALSGPFSDALRGRIAAATRQGGGYMTHYGTERTTAGFTPLPGTIPPVPSTRKRDGYGDQDISAVRGSLEYSSGSGFDAFLTLHYGTDESELVGSTNTNGDRLGRFTPPNDEPWVDYDNVQPFTDTEQSGGVLEMNWRIGDYRITSLTGYETIDRQYGIGDFVPTRVAEANFREDIRSIGQELRLEAEPGDAVRWLMGASYSDDRIDYWRSLVAYDFLRGALGTAYVENDEAFSLFGQAEWRFAPRWLLTGSLRHTDEDKEYDGGSYEINPFGVSRVGVAFPGIMPDGLFANPTFSDDDVSGKLSLNYEPADRTLFYASIAKGYKSGGFDGSGVTQASSFDPFGPETVWAYEVGAKHRRSDDRLFVSGSAFYYDYSDKQELALVDIGGGIIEAVIQNAASSRITGLDLEANWLVADALTLAANLTFLDSEITDWKSANPAEAAARVGNDLPGTPSIMITASATWEHRLGNGLELGATIWGNYSDGAYRDIENTEMLKSDSYGIVNARLDLAGQRGWSVYVYGKNLADRDYVTSVRSLVGMLGQYYGAPRTYGIGVRYEPGR